MNSTQPAHDRAESLAQLAVELIARSVLKAVPIVGPSLDEVVFGIRKKLDDHALMEKLTKLEGEVRRMRAQQGRLGDEEIRLLRDGAATREFREYLQGLQADRYVLAERQVLARFASNDEGYGPTDPDAALRALQAILDGEARIRDQIGGLRGQSRAWLEALRQRRDISHFLDAARAIQPELAEGTDVVRRHYVDVGLFIRSVELQTWRQDGVDGAIAYFLARTPPAQLALHTEQISACLNWISRLQLSLRESGRAEEVARARMQHAFNAVASWARPATWIRIDPPVDLIHRAIDGWMREERPRRYRSSPTIAAAEGCMLASVIAHAGDVGDQVVLVTDDRRHRRIAGGLLATGAPNPVRMVYGAAWREFVRCGGRSERTDVATLASALSNLRFSPGLPSDEVQGLTPALETFATIVQPFHEAVADHLQAALDERLHGFARWVEEFDTGAAGFDTLMGILEDERGLARPVGTDGRDNGYPKVRSPT